MLDEGGLSNYGTGTAWPSKSNNGREEMDEKDQQIAHFRIIARNQKLAEFRPNQQFAMDTADCGALRSIGRNSAFASCTSKSCRGNCHARWFRGRSDAY